MSDNKSYKGKVRVVAVERIRHLYEVDLGRKALPRSEAQQRAYEQITRGDVIPLTSSPSWTDPLTWVLDRVSGNHGRHGRHGRWAIEFAGDDD